MRAILLAGLLALTAAPAMAQERLLRDVFLNQCEGAVRDRGYRVRDMAGYDASRGSQRVTISVERRDDRQRITCTARFPGLGVVLSGFSDRETDRRRPSNREVAQTCQRGIERRDYRVERLVSQSEYRDRRGERAGQVVAFNVRRDGREWRVNCTYGYRSGQTELEILRRR